MPERGMCFAQVRAYGNLLLTLFFDPRRLIRLVIFKNPVA